jgi:hypothetical protein
MERAVRLRVSKQFQKLRAMNIVALDTRRGARRSVDKLTKRCPQQEAGNRYSYRLDAVSEADPLQQKRGVWMDGDPGANLAQFAGLFKNGDVRSTRPQGERGRQATNSAANDGDLKLLRHHPFPYQTLVRKSSASFAQRESRFGSMDETAPR